MEKKEVERAKEIIKNFDPALVMRAMQEIDTKVEDVEKAKDGIRKVYESIPDTKMRAEILSKAVTELEMEVIDKEVKNVRTSIEKFDKEVLLEAAKDYLEASGIATMCMYLVTECIGPEGKYYDLSRSKPPHLCEYSLLCKYPEYLCTIALNCGSLLHPVEEDWRWRKVMTEGLVKEVLGSPELPRAMEKMINEMKKRGEL
ncbi:hypothetical protein C5S36_06750 [Candidatus Methanophagaceae archaeon]|nr:hypothetical protein C5S36_06750 [Methanophagales archaeon]